MGQSRGPNLVTKTRRNGADGAVQRRACGGRRAPRARRGYGTIEVRPRRDEGSPEFDERVRKALRAFARSPGVREFDSLWVSLQYLSAPSPGLPVSEPPN